VFAARYELNSYIVFRKPLVSKRLNIVSYCLIFTLLLPSNYPETSTGIDINVSDYSICRNRCLVGVMSNFSQIRFNI
jgi:hypothetical protein